MEANSNAAAGFLGAIFATMGIFAVVIGVAWYILQVIAYWKIFTKAGRPGWHSIIPILNTWDQVDLSWNRKMAWVSVVLPIVLSIFQSIANRSESPSSFLITIIYVLSVVVLVLTVVGLYKLAKAFGKGTGFFIGLILLNPIFMLILGFGDARYQGPQN